MHIDFAAALDLLAYECDAAHEVLDAGRRVVGRGQLQVTLAGNAIFDVAVILAHIDDGCDAIVEHPLVALAVVLATAQQLWRNFAQLPDRRSGRSPRDLIKPP